LAVSLVASIPSDFLVCPPLDYPLRLAFEGGFFGAPRFHGEPGGDCCSDHFASVTPDGVAGLHQIHEAVDLVSGAGACVYAAYSGTIVGKKQGSLVIDHQGTGEAYATQYLHISPGPKEIGDRVIKGEPIASVRPHPAGDHLHFELWHWIAPSPQGDTDTEAVPVDPTRLLYHWEQALDLDYAVLGSIDPPSPRRTSPPRSPCRRRLRSRRWPPGASGASPEPTSRTCCARSAARSP
jgi:murein DD-endopeptidase MepM/ murein hydrolase activator NlpD